MGEAVAARPIRAARAGVAFGVVDTFLVRAADDAVSHDHGASLIVTLYSNPGITLVCYQSVSGI